MAAIGMRNFVLPGQSAGSLYQILHVGIRAVFCPPVTATLPDGQIDRYSFPRASVCGLHAPSRVLIQK